MSWVLGGPHQVGEWEVKHALRQGEEELRGKDLASREKIEELLATVHQHSAADSTRAAQLQRRGDTVNSADFPQGTTLDELFSLTGAAKSDVEDGNADIPSGTSESSVFKTATAETSSSENRGGSMNPAETGRDLSQQAEGSMLGSKTPLARGSRSTDRVRPSRRKETVEATETAISTAPGAEHPSSAPRPRPRLPRKQQPSSAVPPELTALFRAPLLVPRHLDPPVAGIAAAAVAAGGAIRTKTGTGVVLSER